MQKNELTKEQQEAIKKQAAEALAAAEERKKHRMQRQAILGAWVEEHHVAIKDCLYWHAKGEGDENHPLVRAWEAMPSTKYLENEPAMVPAPQEKSQAV